MKFWQKIYLVTLVLFLIFLNGSIILVYQSAYKETVKMEKHKAIREEQIIVNSLSRDIYWLKFRNEFSDKSLTTLMDSYMNNYRDSKINLELWLDSNLIYSNKEDNFGKIIINCKDDEIRTSIKNIGHKKYVYVCSVLAKPEQHYALVFKHPITDTLKMWDDLKRLFVIVSLLSSIVLAILLFVISKRIAKPLENLSCAARKIARGDYHDRIKVKGKDEVAILAEDFNNMSIKVENKVDELTKEAENKQQFIDNLAHELRTPLTSIQGYAEYMQNVEVTEELRIKYLGYIIHESGRLQNMTKELLTLSLMKNEEIVKKDINIKELIFATKNMLHQKIEKKHLQVLIECTDVEIYANQNLIEILLSNLFENAIRACSINGKIEWYVTKNEKNVKIKIMDNGVGISEENLEHIFEAFYRVDKARSRKEGGAGLGLALCKQILDIHHGKIVYESKEKQGTCVWLLLPIKDFTTC